MGLVPASILRLLPNRRPSRPNRTAPMPLRSHRIPVRWLIPVLSCLLGFVARGAPIAEGSEQTDDATAQELFERVIRPTLIEACYECHSATAEKFEAELRLDTRDGMRRGGESGPAVVPGDPDGSTLVRALRHEDLEMPPDRKLPDTTIAQFVRWIELGAPDPREAAGPPSESTATTIDWESARDFWAFQPPQTAHLPTVGQRQWPRRRHDYFVLARMEQAGLEPSPPASPEMWLRRISMDLIGLPANETLTASLPNAIDERAESQIIDQLLASPHFGERWARLWLDLARYAEDQAHIVGDDKSLFYPNAYRYRDWVIGAFNDGMGYDEFIRLQLAADVCQAPDEHLPALGFLGLGPKYYDRGRLEVKAEEWEDRVDTVCRSILGLTVACARCHDHKYDPIPTSDYYAMASVFASTEMFNRPFEDSEFNEGNGQSKNPEQALHVVREGKPTDLAVFVRGNVQTTGEQSHRGFLTVLSTGSERQLFQSGSGRSELAALIVSRQNPLTARVFVNRVWGQLIGQPIVATPSNFGNLGQPPSHPDVLDDLAARFMANGWSIKWLIREIVASATYRQTSLATADQRRRDPANQWLSHMHRKRLSVEAWRDSLLAAGRRLQNHVGGPSIQPDDPESTRRTVYAAVSRFELNPMLSLYDFPDANVHAAQRVNTTTPLQKLFVTNHPFVIRQATALVDSLASQTVEDPEGAVETMYRRLFARAPLPTERQLAHKFLADAGEDRQMAWIEYAQALLASNEFLFVD